jgi:hypothetical protein
MVPNKLKTFFDYDDAYPTCSRTWATLCIFLPDTTSPDTLTKNLGVQPSITHLKGEVYKGKVRKWPTCWFLESTGKVESKEIRRHIDWLLDQVEHKSEIFNKLQTDGAEIHLSCFWGSSVGHGGPMLDPKILRRIASLHIGITFDIYFEGDDTGETQEPHLQ